VGLYADAAQMVLHEAMSQHESAQLIAREAEIGKITKPVA
jgi:hypothetical protein